jgi:peptide/nickel transport system ATP-binding protein
MRGDDPLLSVENLQTSFELEEGTVTAVDGLSFDIHRGETFGLVGESGSGKSVTALSIMQLVDSPGVVEADAIRFNGRNLLEESEKSIQSVRGGEIGMIFQDPMNSLNPVMRVGEQLAETVRMHGDTGESSGLFSELRRKYVTGTNRDSESWQRAIELLDQVKIPDPVQRAEEYPHQLSGGMRQRVMIAQALAGNPSLIIADEPTTALDVSIESQILSLLLDLVDETDVSVLFITHDLAVVREICDRVAVMYASELMEEAPVEKLFNTPNHPYTQGLMRSIPRITDNNEWLETIEGTVPNLTDKPAGCPFRDRCDRAFDRCDQPLEKISVDSDHAVRCHLYDSDVEATPQTPNAERKTQ